MKLEAKLGISTGVLVSAMLLSAVTAHVRITQANRLSNTITSQQIPLNDAMQELTTSLSLSVRALESTMLFGIEPDTARYFIHRRAKEIADVDAAIAHIRVQLFTDEFDPAERNRFSRIEENIVRLKQLEDRVESLNTLRTQESIAQAYDLTRQQIMPIDAELEQQIYTVNMAQRTIAGGEMFGLNQANRSIVLTLWTGVVISVLVGGGISFLFTRRFARAVCLVAERANTIAAGDLTGKALAIASKDEIGDLCLAMQTMQTNLSTIIGTAIETTRSLTTNADSMHTAGDLIHQRIEQQSQQTQQAATALQEMSASIAEVSRHTQSAADTARAAAQTAHQGGEVVKQMLSSMSSIATAVRETSSTVGLLGEDSKRISQIVTVIDEIARNTNLLALNAAIEAARAGEQGRGFAVVAGEVRRLAESTAQATGQIATMIRGIQDRTHTAIASLATGTATVEQGVVTTNLAGESLGRIIGMAERVDRMIAQIAIAATQQSVAANESSASLHSIYSLSHENLCEMATTAAGIETLRATAIALQQQVVHFHLADTPAPPPANSLKPPQNAVRRPGASPRLTLRRSGSSPRRSSPPSPLAHSSVQA